MHPPPSFGKLGGGCLGCEVGLPGGPGLCPELGWNSRVVLVWGWGVVPGGLGLDLGSLPRWEGCSLAGLRLEL